MLKEIVESYESMRGRENLRFRNGLQKYVPLIREYLSDREITDKDGKVFKRFPFISLKEGDSIPLVGYIASYKHGLQDRKTFMKFGRYIKKFYPGQYSDKELEKHSAEYSEKNGAFNLLFARTSAEIQKVYQSGPPSCMSKHPLQLNNSDDLWHPDYDGDRHRYYNLDADGLLHPVQAYGEVNGPLDLSVAYITSVFNPDKIVTRAVCWESKKVYLTVYGSSSNGDHRLVPALKKLGFKQTDQLQGARLRKIMFQNNYVVPYLDINSRRVTDTGKYLVIDYDGEIVCESIDGIGMLNNANCFSCDCNMGNDEGYNDNNGNLYCDNCRAEYLYCCTWCDEYFNYNNVTAHYWEGEGDVCNNCYLQEFKTCKQSECNNIGTKDSMGSWNLVRTCNSCILINGLTYTGYKTIELGRPIYVKLNEEGKIIL